MGKRIAEAEDVRDLLEDIFSWKSPAFFAALFAMVRFILYCIARVIFG